ncbi:cutinase family protein [Mycobacterium sp. 1423905.2]|uniref:cutinase family protein n=1 Tax=Mycobacterium sp. 1423905.2 TaxID=1856859 RepID=UPI0007FF6821|nr:cutinase family protein [Mycobacterium sp. 1423905.2]OBJ50908.1 hypothetical protein A9W95_23020 [Mycobacterium sp. 1423905.2]
MTRDSSCPTGEPPGLANRYAAGLGAPALIAAVLLASSVVSLRSYCAFQPDVRNFDCADIQVVLARDTDEPPGPGRVGEAFTDSLRYLVPAKSVKVYAVDYPASHDYWRAADGANDASRFVQNTVKRCPSSQLVLSGYSQGAAVIDFVTVAEQPMFGYTDVMPPEVASHVAAVVVFANPLRPSGPLDAVAPIYGSRTIDLCNGADPMCSNGVDLAAHNSYVESGKTAEAARFAADRLNASAKA